VGSISTEKRKPFICGRGITIPELGGLRRKTPLAMGWIGILTVLWC